MVRSRIASPTGQWWSGLQQVMTSGEIIRGGWQGHCGCVLVIVAAIEGTPGCSRARCCVAKRWPGIEHGQSLGVQQMTRVAPIVLDEGVGAAHHHGSQVGQSADYRRGGLPVEVQVTGRGVDVPTGRSQEVTE
jgi:hypothetical protein